MKKALVLSLVAILCLGAASFAQTLSGKWNTTVTITPNPVPPVTLLAIKSELIVTYSISGWSFSSDTLLKDTGWNAQKFDVTGTLGAFTVSSDLVFAPSTLQMIQWVTSTELSLAGVDLTAKFVSVPGDVALLLTGKGTAGNVDVSATVKLGSAWYDADGVGTWCTSAYGYPLYWYAANPNDAGCDFDFNSIDITVGFPFCCADVTAEVYFTCAGFQYADFGVTGIQVPNLPWFGFDANLHFTTQTKTIVLTPEFNFGNDACFNLYISQNVAELDDNGQVTVPGFFTLGNISLDGIDFTCTLGGVTIYDISWWGHEGSSIYDKPGILYATNYWEAFKLTTSDDACCGPFSFALTMYFLNGGTQLFDISKITASMGLQVAQQFKFTTGITLNLETIPTFSQWTVGFLVTW